MRQPDEARDDAAYHAAQLIDALQDGDAPQELIDRAETLQSEIAELAE